jgi:DNA modification methylase
MTLRLEFRPLDSLTSAKRNPKRHDPSIAASLERFGVADSIGVIDERTGRLLGGHGRVEALRAMKANGKPAPVGVEVKGDAWIVPVLLGWSSKDDAEGEAALVAMNETSRAGGWNAGGLTELLKDLGSERAKGIGFDSKFLAGIFKAPGETEEEAAEIVDPEPSAEVWVKDGTLFAMGPHRLLVGDSLTVEARARLFGSRKFADAVITDPPYAIFGSSSGIGRDIADDKMVRPFFEAFFKAIAERLKWTGHLYAFTDWRSYASLWEAMKRVDVLVPKNALVWNKGGSGLGTNYAMTYELCFFAHKLEVEKAMSSGSKGIRPVHRPNVFNFNRPSGAERLHNAAKPVKLLEEMIGNSTDPGESVWDPCSGSGSTLIACENSGRVALMGEIDPKNAQITVERWQRATGKTAEVVEV